MKFSISRHGGDPRAALGQVLDDVTPSLSGLRVFVKPNFTYPFPKEGVTTTRAALVGLVELLYERGAAQVTIGEGEGGYNSFSMDETFTAFELAELTSRLGCETVNVAHAPSTSLSVTTRRFGDFTFDFPRAILESTDLYISMPVPKVHCMTGMSGAVKNAWGLVQDSMRVRLHPALNEILAEIDRRLPLRLAVVDGTYGLTRNGPMIDGQPLELGWFAAADDLRLADHMLCEVMGMDVRKVAHLWHAVETGEFAVAEADKHRSTVAPFVDERFYLRRNLWNRSAKLTWYSPRLNHLVYFSGLSGVMHKVMYKVRSKPPELSVKGVDWH